MKALFQSASFYNAIQDFFLTEQVRYHFVKYYVAPKLGNRILDIGCGTGELQPYFGGCDYVGFDHDPKYLEHAKNAGRPGQYFLGDVGETQLADESFDIAFAAGVLHHLDDKRAEALFKLAMRVLKPGGHLATFDMCDRNAGWIQNLMNRLDRGKFVRTQEGYVELAKTTFSEIEVSDYCGRLRIPVSHCVLVCRKP